MVKERKTKMKKKITAVLIAALMIQSGISVSASETAIVTPQNVINLQITDSYGRKAPRITGEIYNSAGVCVGLYENGRFKTCNSSGIEAVYHDKESWLYVPWEQIEQHVVPMALLNVEKWHDENSYYTYEAGEPVPFMENKANSCILRAYDPYENETAYTLLPGMMALNVSPEWTDQSIGGYVEVNRKTYYFRDKETVYHNYDQHEISICGNVTLHEIGDVPYTPDFGFDNFKSSGTGGNFSYLDTSSYREYILHRMHLSEIDSRFRADGTFADRSGNEYNFRNQSGNTAAAMIIVSGGFINAVLPDENGYVEFYVRKDTRKFHMDVARISISDSSTSSGFHIDAYAADYVVTKAFQCTDMPDTGMNLVYVPADTYSLKVSSVEANSYKMPENDFYFTVADSTKVQTVPINIESLYRIGDIDANESIELSDATAVLEHYAAKAVGQGLVLSEWEMHAADIDYDEEITIADATAILRYYAEQAAGLAPEW